MTFNFVQLMGNLVDDVELRYMADGTAIADFRLADSRRWKSKDGSQKEKVSYLACVAFGTVAETFAKHHGRGDAALITGHLTQERWEDKEGKKRDKVKVTVDKWFFVKRRQSSTSQTSEQTPASPKPAAVANEGERVPF